ncbi:MAG TPA: DUF6150 family protein [Catalimonadaceae bacterium]|nr:DUF6150 family protein [Catalimonadaceae bacterium]
MRLILLILALWFLQMRTSLGQNAYCQLKGPVFVDTNPARIQYRVFLEESESFADLVVFKAANALFADKPGLWFFTPVRAQAAFSIMFVKERSQADFSIFYIETESFAGCQNQK